MGVSMDGSYIFHYQLQDAWRLIVSEVAVFEGPQGGTVRTVRYDIPTRFPDLTPFVQHDIFLDKETIDRIEERMRKHEEVFSIHSLEDNWVIDGAINIIEFNLDDKKNEIEAFNLSAVRNKKHRKTLYDETPVKSMKVLKLFNEIAGELIAAGVENKYFRLDIN